MKVVQTKKSVRPGRARRYGGTLVKIEACDDSTTFYVHEDIMSATSDWCHGDRKNIEGECCVCHKIMDPELDDLTFCHKGCGMNFHVSCIVQKHDKEKSPACPACYAQWKVSPTVIKARTNHAFPLYAAAIRMYCDWLYTDKIQLPKADDANTDHDLILMQAWTLAQNFEDDPFRYAVVAKYVDMHLKNPIAPPSAEAVQFAWKTASHNADDDFNFFVADAFMASHISFHDRDVLSSYPRDWLVSMYKDYVDFNIFCDTCLEDMLHEWSDGYEIQYEDGDETLT